MRITIDIHKIYFLLVNRGLSPADTTSCINEPKLMKGENMRAEWHPELTAGARWAINRYLMQLFLKQVLPVFGITSGVAFVSLVVGAWHAVSIISGDLKDMADKQARQILASEGSQFEQQQAQVAVAMKANQEAADQLTGQLMQIKESIQKSATRTQDQIDDFNASLYKPDNQKIQDTLQLVKELDKPNIQYLKSVRSDYDKLSAQVESLEKEMAILAKQLADKSSNPTAAQNQVAPPQGTSLNLTNSASTGQVDVSTSAVTNISPTTVH